MERIDVKIGLDASEAAESLAVTRADVQKLEQAIQTLTGAVRENTRSLKEDSRANQENTQSAEANAEATKEQAAAKDQGSEAMQSHTEAMEENSEANRNNSESLSNVAGAAGMLPGPIGRAASSVSGLTNKVGGMMKSGWLLFLAAVAAGYEYLTWSMSRTVEGQEKLDAVTARMNQRLENVKDAASAVGRALFNAFDYAAHGAEILSGKIDNIWNRVRDFGGGFAGKAIDFIVPDIGKAGLDALKWFWNRNVDEAEEYARRSNELWQQRQKSKIEEANLEREVSEAREKLYDRTLSIEEREKAYKDAVAANNKLFEIRKHLAEEEYAIAKGRNSLSDSDRAALEKEADLQAQTIRLETQRSDAQRMLLRMKNGLSTQQDSADHAAAEEAKRLAMEREETHKHADEIAEATREAEDAIMDATIAGIRDNRERERAEREEQHKRKLRDIALQEDEIYKAIYEHRKRQWELTHEDSPYENTASGKLGWQGVKGSTLSDDEQGQVATAQAEAEAKRRTENARYAREVQKWLDEERAALLEYIREYGSIQEQRAAITREYDEKIAATSDEVQKASLRRQKETVLSELNFKGLQAEIDWETVFGNLTRLSTRALTELKEKLRKALDAKDITAENAQVVTEKILEIEDQIASKGGFGSNILPALRERERIEERVALLQERQNKAAEEATRKATALQQARGHAVAVLGTAGVNKDDGTAYTSMDFEGMSAAEIGEWASRLQSSSAVASDALRALATATTDATRAEEEKTRAQEIVENEKEILKGFKGKGVAGGMKEIFTQAVEAGGGGALGVIGLIGQNANSLASFSDKIGLAGTDFGDAVHGFADGVNGFQSAIGALAQGDIFGAVSGVFDGIVGFGKTLTSVFGINWSGGNEDEVREVDERLIRENEKLTGAIERLRATIDKSNGMAAIEAGAEAKEAQARKNRNLLARWDNDMGYHSAHHSNGYYYDIGDWAAGQISQRLGKTVRATHNEDLLQLTPEEMNIIRTEMADVWDTIVNQGKYQWVYDALNEYADQAGKIAAIDEQLKQNLTQLTVSGLHDSFLNELMDMKRDVGDFSDDFSQYLMKAVMNAQIGNLLDKDLEDWRNDLARRQAAGGGTLSKQDVKELRAQWDAIVEKGIEQRDVWAEVTGYEGSGSSGSGTASGRSFQAMSQETGDEMSGRLTAVVISGNEQAATQKLILANIASMASVSRSGFESLQELAAARNSYLSDIARYSKKIYDDFKERLESIAGHTESL